MYSSDRHPLTHVFGVFRGNMGNPSFACSDSDTQTEVSGAYKNYESDSSDFDTGNNMDEETVTSDANMEQDNGGSECEG